MVTTERALMFYTLGRTTQRAEQEERAEELMVNFRHNNG
jgi:hypothetical protein